MKKQTPSYIITLILVVLISGMVIGQAQTPSTPTYINVGSMTETASYVIWKDGSYYYAKNGTTGAIDYFGTNMISVWENVRDNGLTSDRTWKEKVVVKGNIGISTTIVLPSYVTFDFSQARLYAENSFSSDLGGTGAMIRNEDVTNGNNDITIICGVLDGRKDFVSVTFSGIFLRYVENTSICDGTIVNMPHKVADGGFGIFISRGAGAGSFVNQSERVFINNVNVYDCDWDNIAVTSDYVEIENSYSSNSGRCGITFEESRYCQLNAGSYLGNTEYGVEVTASNFITLTNFYSEENGYGGASTANSNHITFTGFTSRTNNLGVTGNHGFYGVNVYSLILTKSNLYDNDGWGIRITGNTNSYNISINDNQIQENNAGQVYLDAVDIQAINNIGYITTNTISATVANNEDVSHGLDGKPDYVFVTTANVTYDGVPVIVGWDEVNSDSTNARFTCVWANGTAITSDAIYITASVVYEP